MDRTANYIQRKTKCKCTQKSDGTIVVYSSLNDIKDHLLFLRDNEKCRCELLVDIFGIDYPDRKKRFELIYNLLSVVHNIRVYVKLQLHESDVPTSTVSIFSAASWFEREVFDMYGVEFSDHPDLRRILTDYGFKGHPMLKDFPLTGYEEVEYDIKARKVVYNPISLSQDLRVFDSLSPWKGGDDKVDKVDKE